MENLYKWKGKKAEQVVLRFCLADEMLSTRNEPGMMQNYREACCIADWLTDRYEIDINDEAWRKRMEQAPERSWKASRLIGSCLSIASVRLPPYMVSADRMYRFKQT